MFTISVETGFSAPHQLTLPDGSKEPLHNHDWVVTAEVASEELDSMGIVMDFHRLKAMVDEITSDFAGKQLDDHEYFAVHSSSAETVARYIYERLEPQLARNVKLVSVSVIEEPLCRARFSK